MRESSKGAPSATLLVFNIALRRCPAISFKQCAELPCELHPQLSPDRWQLKRAKDLGMESGAGASQCPSTGLAALDGTFLHVLGFADWKLRATAAGLSKDFRRSLGNGSECEAACVGLGDGYWRFLSERLASEFRVYVPELTSLGMKPPVGVAATWRELFLALFPLALLPADDATATPSLQESSEVFKVRVMTRFRPSQTDVVAEEERAVTLPLHQKVQLVRKQLGCSSAEALRAIMKERAANKPGALGGGSRGDDGLVLPNVAMAAENKENIEVESARSENQTAELTEEKPNLDSGTDTRCQILSVRQDNAEVLAVTRNAGLQKFSYHRVFPEVVSQNDVYELAARQLVTDFLNGTSASVICYGQTGSGKTHTMFGLPGTGQGLVPRACSEILTVVKSWRQRGEDVQLGVTYVELFGSEVSDLLREGQVVGQGLEGRYSAVRATDRVGHRYVLDGHTEHYVNSIDHVQELLRIGDGAKRRAATAMNDRSTRAHTVFILSLAAGPVAPGGPSRKSRFFFADLGGSEKLSKSKVDADTKSYVTVVGGEELSRLRWSEYYEHRKRVQETLNINYGLYSLKRVIDALHRRSQMSREGVPWSELPYIPYQDSKLTMLLHEALGGSARTLILATATMDVNHAGESIQTLRFAETCAQIEKKGELDQTAALQAALQQVDDEIRQLQAEIVRKERWETRVVQRSDVDTIAGAFGEEEEKVERAEEVRTTMLVGAEQERQRLELLLTRQTELQGLTGLNKDYRSMKAAEASDGGKGVDFRQSQRFSAKMKAKDFEDEVVMADAIRFLFRKTSLAKQYFGETDATIARRLHRHEIPEGYFEVARKLREGWEERIASGQEKLPFGKVMMDRCQDWQARFQQNPDSREEAMAALVSECSLDAGASSVPDEF